MSLFIQQNARLKTYTVKQDSLIKDRFEKKLKNDLVKDVNDLGIPGIQVSIIIKDKAYDFSIGTIDYDRNSEITNDNILRVGSITKLYTSTIIMKLFEDGLLSLDTTIDRWFHEIPYAKKITIRNLLDHTSGIYSYTENYSFAIKTILSPKKIWKPDEIYQYILKGKPYFSPGEEHYYSNSNYLLLGLIAENITGKKYSELLHEIVINNLNLKHTFFLSFERYPDLLITGYDRDVIPFGVHKIEPDNSGWASAGYSAGGIASNSMDIAKFLRALFSYEIIDKATLEKMIEFQNFIDEDIPEQTGYGLGLRRLVIEKDILIGHTGTIPGFGGAAFYCLDKEYYITILGNVSYLNQTHLLCTIVKVINEKNLTVDTVTDNRF